MDIIYFLFCLCQLSNIWFSSKKNQLCFVLWMIMQRNGVWVRIIIGCTKRCILKFCTYLQGYQDLSEQTASTSYVDIYMKWVFILYITWSLENVTNRISCWMVFFGNSVREIHWIRIKNTKNNYLLLHSDFNTDFKITITIDHDT